MAQELTPDIMNAWNEGGLPHMLGIRITACGPGRVEGRLPVKKELIAGNGALWAPAIVALADTLCAYGVSTKWPDGANGFTTVELKCNFMGRCGTRGSSTKRPESSSPRSAVHRSFSIRGPEPARFAVCQSLAGGARQGQNRARDHHGDAPNARQEKAS